MKHLYSLPVTLLLVLCLSSHNVNAQFGGFNLFRPFQDLLKPVMRFFAPRFKDDGTQSPQATGIDKLFPDDCGRDVDKGTGKLCFPDGKLCENSKSNKYYRRRPSNCSNFSGTLPSNPLHE